MKRICSLKIMLVMLVASGLGVGPAFASGGGNDTFRETLTLAHTLMSIPRLEDQTRENVLAYLLSLQ